MMYWYNEKERIIAIKYTLGVEADPADWREITQEEKERIEAEWAAEEATETE